jgi:hypothetical protein
MMSVPGLRVSALNLPVRIDGHPVSEHPCMGVVAPHTGESMLVAALPERFEGPTDGSGANWVNAA